ncbi:hypothetical protein [Planctomycetes bacterium K23_9]|uniref:Uncharacterized protein n=1 Tax=Stieleria marina TaxID=1930275 RepID=A0A517NP04_9BACT|nr:hypothetical protein K239x_08080 [Planctomycetes bacterium K23_9]
MRSICFGIFIAFLSTTASAQQDWVSSWVLNGQTEAQFEKQLKSDYEMQVNMIDRLCDLRDAQRSKLTLAADADVTRFFRDVAKIRKKIAALDLKGNQNDDINKIFQVVSPLRTHVQNGVFGDQSLFHRVSRSVLTTDQQELYAAEIKKNRQRRCEAIVRVNVADLERSMPMLADQRDKLMEVLDAQELPTTINQHMEGYSGFLKLVKARKNAKQDFEKIFDAKQMKVIDQYCDRYQGWVP